ncbi:putative peroxiredoxin [compost metagenome]
MIEPGSLAPDFRLKGIDAQGNESEYQLSELLKAGKPVVVFAYPRDNTPGCTTEACDFRDRASAFDDRAIVLGVSADSLESHRKFQTKHGLNFPLLSDPDKQMLSAYGAWGEKKLYGKVSLGIIRSTFVIHPDGTLAKAYRNVKVNGHAEKVLGEL